MEDPMSAGIDGDDGSMLSDDSSWDDVSWTSEDEHTENGEFEEHESEDDNVSHVKFQF
jgi:hypothetical protein